jgi:uncharacterized LabA/DUF88 family protein
MENIAPVVVAYIDGTNMHLSTVNMGWKIDHYRFRVLLRDLYHVQTAYYFLGYVAQYDSLWNSLKRAGYEMVNIEPTRLPNGDIKGNCDSDLVFKAMLDFPKYDKAVLVASDGDYRCLVDHLKTTGKLERVVACSRGGCAVKLKKAAGSLIDFLDDFRPKTEYIKKGATP